MAHPPSHSHAHHESHGQRAHTLQELEHQVVEHDTWFRHEAGEPHHQSSHGETNGAKIIGFLTVIIVIVAVCCAAGFQYYKMAAHHEYIRKWEKRTDAFGAAQMRATKEQWKTTLETAAWIDAKTGVVRLPAPTAERLVIEEYQAKAPR